MIKRSELITTAIKIPVDFLMLILAGLLAYWIRYKDTIQEIRPVIFDLPFSKYLTTVILVALAWLIFFAWAGLYRFKRRTFIDELTRIILACSTGMTALIVYMFFMRELFSSRFIVLTAWVLSIIAIFISRSIIRKIKHLLYKKNIGTNKVVIIGSNKNTEAIINTLTDKPELGYKIIKHFGNNVDSYLKELKNLHKKKRIDEILQTDPSISRKDSIKLIEFCTDQNILFKYAAGQFETRTTNVAVHMIGGVPVVEVKKTKLDGWGKIIKRIIDIIGSLSLLIILSPVILILIIAIKIDSRGPVVYKNERVGYKGKLFTTYKFRRLKIQYCTGKGYGGEDALKMEDKLIKEKSTRKGPLYKIKDDPRETSMGKFLEKTSLDELPQLFNVLIGNMSLVGPRPHQQREVEKYETYHKHLLEIKPGVSGLAQISGRSNLSFEEEAKLDIYYIENWSLKLDFWIFLKTPLAVVNYKKK